MTAMSSPTAGDEGINIAGSGVTGHIIQGNYIGLDPDGATGPGNSDVGLAIITGSGNTIGGTSVAARNVISNNFEGIEINTDNNIVQGNYIGTDAGGTLDRGNRSDDGVEIKASATGNLIGGTAAGAGNLIAFNALDGVYLVNGSGNSVLGNQIHSNSGLGIDLGVGANNDQSFPVLGTADVDSPTQVTIDGTFNSTASTTFRIEFYKNTIATGQDPSNHGEGETYLGFTTVTTDGVGNATFNTTLTASVTVGEFVTATATVDLGGGNYGDTSEFALNVTATAANNSPVATNDPLNFNSYLTGLSPLGYWRLGEGAGPTVVDETGTNNGTYVNIPTLGAAGVLADDSSNTSVTFDGTVNDDTGDYVEIAHDASYLIDEGAIQFWFNTADVTQDSGLFSKDALGFGNGGHVSIDFTPTSHVSVRLQSTTTDYTIESTQALTASQWHHVVFTFGSQGMKLYVDGQLEASDVYTGGLGTSSGGSGNDEPLTIGASTQLSGSGTVTPTERHFDGQIDEVAFLNLALSAEEVQDLHAAALQHYTVDEDSTLNILAPAGVLGNDFDFEGDPLTAVNLDTTGTLGLVTLNLDGSFNYDPNGQFENLNVGDTATDTFTYTANDGGTNSAPATVTMTVTGVNDVPVATGNTVVAQEDVPLVIGAGDFSFTDVESDGLVSVTITGLTLNGGTLTHTGGTVPVTNGMTVTLAELADLTFTSAFNDSTNSSFTYTVNDAGLGVTSAVMNITVNAVNDVPVATGNTVVAQEDVPLVIGAGAFSFTDVESDGLVSVTITGLTLNGGTLTHTGGTVPVTNGMTVTLAELADLTFTSALNDSTNSSFTYTVNDAGLGVTSARHEHHGQCGQ